jgi:uncharacterized protein
MKIITTIVVVSVVSLLGWAYLRNPINKSAFPVPDNSPNSTSTGTSGTLHPLSIDSLRRRQFPPQNLTIEREVSTNSQVVSYLSDNFKLNALMITPAGTPPEGGWPIVIVNHGHIPPEQYSVTRSYINTSNYFASQGFLVLKPDYRGHDDSAGESSGRLFSRSEYTVDVLSLLSAIDSIPNVNSGKIFMYGHSMGGEITLQVLETSNRITAATLWAPAVTSLPNQVTHFMNKRQPTPGQAETFKTQYDEFIKNYSVDQISSIENIDSISTPLNIHHATADESVPYSWGTALDKKLKAAGKTVNFYSYQGDNHDISGNFGKALSRDAAFFKTFL